MLPRTPQNRTDIVIGIKTTQKNPSQELHVSVVFTSVMQPIMHQKNGLPGFKWDYIGGFCALLFCRQCEHAVPVLGRRRLSECSDPLRIEIV